MGYSTEFSGHIEVSPPLNAAEINYLTAFARSRRMKHTKGPYFVEGSGDFGQDHERDVEDYNQPPEGQPGLWCQWVPSEDGESIQWDGGEKFYQDAGWMEYLMQHFIGSNPLAKQELPFLQGHTCNGEILAQGQDINDRWKLIVQDNAVSVKQLD